MTQLMKTSLHAHLVVESKRKTEDQVGHSHAIILDDRITAATYQSQDIDEAHVHQLPPVLPGRTSLPQATGERWFDANADEGGGR